MSKEALHQDNYRSFAAKVIDAYASKGRFIDAMMWRTIVNFYEADRLSLIVKSKGG